MAAAVPAEVVFSILNDDWKSANVPKPKIKARETAEELREEIPKQGLVLIYCESGGRRIVPRGNRMYKDELVNVTIETHTIQSHEHLYQLQDEVIRILEENTRTVSPYQICRPLSSSEEWGTTFRYWRGNVRVELSKAAVRTGYAGPAG